MNTTAMVIEILIVGLQTVVWLTLIVLTIFGYKWVPLETLEKWSGPIVLFIIGMSYTLGILFDRLWDFLLHKSDKKIRAEYFNDSRPSLHDVRATVFSSSERMARFIDYIRSRMRIGRASTGNFCLITINSLLFVLIRLSGLENSIKFRLLVFISALGASLILLSLYGWKKLIRTYYKQLVIVYKTLGKGDELPSRSPPSEKATQEKTNYLKRKSIWCYIHLLVYIGVNTPISVYVLFKGGFFWPIFLVIFWGAGLFVHFVQFLEDRRKVRRDLQALKKA